MMCGAIDVGSNTIRLVVVRTDGDRVETLFNKKITAGLIGYVKGGELSPDGVECAVESLLEIKSVTDSLGISPVRAFATASLRNISNSESVLESIRERTGFELEILSGAEEAEMGSCGVRPEIASDRGLLFDIGGGSTEITIISPDGSSTCRSFPIGSLGLYTKCVKKAILPDRDEQAEMIGAIRSAFADGRDLFPACDDIYAVGGSARAMLLIAKCALGLPKSTRTLTIDEVDELLRVLLKGDRTAIDLMLKKAPDRVHTLIPGIMILHTLAADFRAERVTVCTGGVRDGYILRRLCAAHI